MQTKRQKPEVRRAAILAAALEEVAAVGLLSATCDAIAERAECSTQLVKHYYGTMTQLRRDVMRLAIRTERADVLAQGLAARDIHALKAPGELKKRAAQWLEGVC